MSPIALVTDLIFSTKITGTGKQLGNPVAVARTLPRLSDLLDAATDAPLLLVDLNITAVDPLAAIRLAKSHPKNPRVVAFLSHVQVELARQAQAAGADQVLSRSAFVEILPSLLIPAKP